MLNVLFQALNQPFEDEPGLVEQQPHCFDVAIWYWNNKGLNSYADKNTQTAFDTITRRINGGLNGKADRDSLWRQAKQVLSC